MRLIDAEPLIDECKECSSIEWNKKCFVAWADAEEDFAERLECAPTIPAIPADAFRSLLIKRMTVDSETKDRRSKNYNQAIFGYRSDGDTFPCFSPMDMDMVLEAFDNAVKDYFAGMVAKEKKER